MSTARDAMIDSAITLFRQRGVADTSLRDVVEHAGAPRGSIYHHFPGGKDELALAATERAGQFISALLDTLAEQDPAQGVQGFVDYWRGALVSADFRDGCPIAAAALAGEAPSASAAAGQAFSRWETLLADALATRGHQPDEARSLATLAIAAVEGALLMSRAQRSPAPLERVAAQLRSQLERGAGEPPS